MVQIEVIGIGLDGATGLTTKTQEIIKKASILIGSSRHLSYFAFHSAQKIRLNNLQQNLDEIAQLIKTQEKIVILTSGDPLFFGLGRLLLEKFPQEKLNFHPHVSSIQFAFNKIKVPWQDAKIISVHGRDGDELSQALKQGIEKIAILTDGNYHPGAIAKLYLSLELPVNYRFWICENLGDNTEKITYFTGAEIAELALLDRDSFAALNVVILIRESLSKDPVYYQKLPLIGIPDTAFCSFRDRPGLITKKEVRTVILGQLALQAKQIVWDIGAGTGSVSIEIARLSPRSQIFAVEKTAIGISLIEKNCQNFQVKNISIISGKAPENLNLLPAPNRIFIGGSGGNLSSILEFCQEKILPQGIVVIALATIENCHEALDWIKGNHWQYSLLQLQISRSASVGSFTRFSPLNPVTIITTNPNF
ncbi:MAG: precorrin-6y C5,15-methyltransferase (decarboxylating) subunit CbiE [Xenococcus sp. MO_188.B8]|nr:precorrin-6y C5,15-methyltransferase (decarboxylating) subunit CbiE [Xenococcus sp. MO_188.B8]